MAKIITMPKLGESVTEGTIDRWLVGPGDQVKRFAPIAEVITDKVNAEIPAEEAGTVGRLLVQAGQTVAVGTPIMELETGATTAGLSPAAAGPAEAVAAATPIAAVSSVAAPARAAGAAEPASSGPRGARYSPAVMRLAQEHSVDLSRLSGTGEGGRITRKDVEAYIAAGKAAAPVAPTPATAAPAPAASPAGQAPVAREALGADDQAVPVTAVRRAIAQRMVQSKQTAPHAWTMINADVTGLVRLREANKEAFLKREGVPLTYMPFFIKAVCEALREHPVVNSTWADDQIIIKRHINISVAVALEDALVVPVIHDADRLSTAGLAHAVNEVAQKARAGKLTLRDVSGGTFTVNNTGAFGSIMSAPIINYPQAAILAFESIRKEPVVLEGDAIAIRSTINLCMSLDHRVLDGLAAGRFLQSIRRRLEAYTPGQEIC